ncbi:protein-glutamate methylesterase/protein-glutamine glutaminase [Fictibacillus barbaricus]|uniref:Protein-glutamate methylesterase/protein-glutamine glutaminase n=1 Tax=Fictibacillus barbaricus TaxID=182136 RepID=A0ABU1TY70_9BACL|nr:chemotaxis response regulator protein-glutamate methylesterase [Fictibacillus barbaricus]MDR7072160.1 two-component system chemotaxis response regulator CheB [Fictibacillus barbaricus]
MKQLSVLVVDDSAFMRKLIKDFLNEDPRITVLDTARNGEEAVTKIMQLKPDVVTMDVEMPVLNGIEAVKEIMKCYPVPIIMLSSTTKAGAENTILAMEAGALDFISKPSGAISLDLHKVKSELIEKVIAVSKMKIKLNKPMSKPSLRKHEKKVPNKNEIPKLVLIGTSTGGPRALQEVITKWPADFKAPVVIVQHMPPGFTESLANRLNSLSSVNVKEAEQDDVLTAGTAYIAPGGFHLRLIQKAGKTMVSLDKEPPVGGHRPAVNVLFESASKIKNIEKIAVILTGMGSDGTHGLIKLKESGEAVAIAEAEESCIVYGMPKSAVLTKKVDEVIHLHSIAAAIQNYL